MDFDTAKLIEMAWQIINAMLVVAIPIAAIYIQKWGSAFVAKKRLELTAEQNARVDAAISFAMATAQQLKINGVLPDGTAAKNWVITQAQAELKKYNIPINVADLSDKIEGNYNNMLSTGIPDKQWLIDQAIDIGVAAYKTSGVSEDVKGIVVEFSKKYLAEFGVTVNAEVLEGLALSKLNALK
jgi:hypothetical protein